MKKLARRGLAFVLSFLMIASTAYSDMSFVSHAKDSNHVWTKVGLNEISSNDSIAITMTTSDGKTYVLPNAKSTNKGPAAIVATVDGNNLTVDEGADADYAWNFTKYTVEETAVTDEKKQSQASIDTLNEGATEKNSEDSDGAASKDEQTEENSEGVDSKDEQTEKDSETTASKDEQTEKISDGVASKNEQTEGNTVADTSKTEKQVSVDAADQKKTVTRTYYTISHDGNYLYTIANNSGMRVNGMPKDEVGAQWKLSDYGYFSAKDSKDVTRFLGVYTSAPDWRAYTNVNNNIKGQTLGFYKLTNSVAGETVAAPTASVESGTAVDFGTEVTLSCSTENAKIYYNLNGSEDNFSPYEKPIVITGKTTIYAKAKLDDKDSVDVHFDYTLNEGTKITDLTKMDEGQEFILTNGDNNALTTTAAEKKLAGYTVKLDDEKHLTVDDETAALAKLKLVKTETEGEYNITSDIMVENVLTTKYLTCEATGSSLSFVEAKDDYSTWTVEPKEDGSFLIKNTKALYHNNKTNTDNPQYLEYFKGFTTYSYNEKSSDAYKLNAYTYPKVVKPENIPTKNTLGKLLTRKFYDGDQVVVYYPASKQLMTAEANNGKFKGVEVAPSEDGTIETKDSKALVLTVSVDENGQYTLKTEDGKYLTATVEKNEKDGKIKTYCGLALNDEASDNSIWYLKDADENKAGNYYLMNANAKNGSYDLALEYYNGFTTYGYKADAAFVFNFYALEEGEKTDIHEYAEDKFTVAQWAGNAHYNEFEACETTIYGDKYKTNDMLDVNATYTVSVNGAASKPWTSATSRTTGSTSFYMGSTGVVTSSDYMQFALSTAGFGNMDMSLRMRASNTAAGAFQLQYSTDGESFKNFKAGKYSYKYTSYKKTGDVGEDGKPLTEPFEVNGSGDITDGIAKTALAPGNYVNFTFDVPNAAANAEKLYIRLVPNGDLSAKGDKAPAKGGVIRVDTVKIEGNPIVSDKICGYVKTNPAAGEVATGQTVELISDTEGAEIYYSVNGAEFTKYDEESKVVLNELPATIEAYAKKEGLKDSIATRSEFTQAQVQTVKATPNGGAVSENTNVTLKTKTEGASIYYRYIPVEEEKKETQPAENQNTNDLTEEKSEEENPAYDEIEWVEYTAPFKLKEFPAQIQVKAVKEGYKDSAVSTIKFTKRINDKYNIYFGQIHAHTNISDGAGSLEDALKHATNVKNLDYIAITDHSNSIDNEKESKITENVDKSADDEWTYAHNLSKQYSSDKFTCVYGYEMTWSNGLGHMNTYNTPGFQSRTQTEFATYGTALNNYYAALRTVPDSISQFNHPGTTFGDFQDFSYFSEENDALITMIEVGNGEGTIGSSGYFPSYEYYTRALDKGWHVAPTNNQDNHKGKWGDANTARTVMLADTNNEDAVYDAMRNYRIYATEDNDLSIYYTLDDYIMGTILEQDAVGDTVKLKADIKDPTDEKIGKVEVIVNGGQSIAYKNVDTNEATVEFEVPSSYSYYYLKITEADGDIAVTAPVWVGEVEACGINKTYTNTVLPVKGESLDVNVDLYNNEKADLEIEDVEVVLKDVDGNISEVLKATGTEVGVEKVASNSTASFKTDYVYNEAGQVTYEVKVHALLNGVKKTYTDKLQVSYAIPEMVTDVIVDGTHFNDYVTGYYYGNTTAFTSLAAKKNIRVTVEEEKITPEMLEDCKLLVVSAPAKKTGDANGKSYTPSHFEDEFLTMVKDYVAKGGSVIVCGLADYVDSTESQTAIEQNKLLEAIGATIRMGSDEVWDDTNNGGQAYRLHPTNFNMESPLLDGIRDGQKYSQYSGCSVDISNAKANDVVDEAQWLVKGFDTTLSMDCKGPNGEDLDANKPNDNKGNVTFIASQNTKAGGQIIVAGGVFLSDFEVKAEIDNNDSLPYANYTIVNNILDGMTAKIKTSTIAEARAGKMNEVFAVEGYVTSGTTNPDTTFFDTIYIQDETAGIDIFPYATPGLAIGTKMRIVGYKAQYQGDVELKVLSSEILKDDPYIWEAKEVDTKTAMDYDTLGGSLLKTAGKVTRFKLGADGAIEEFWLKDDTGVEAAIFIDGYIKSGKTGDNTLENFVKVGAEVSATGILYMHPEGDSAVSVPVFRVRDCDDIKLVNAAPQKSDEGKSVIEKAAEKVYNYVKNVIEKIKESPIVKAIGDFFGFGKNSDGNRGRRGRTARNEAVVETPATVESIAETPAEEETTKENAEEATATIDDESTPLAAEEKSIPVVPIAAVAVIIVAGAGVAIFGSKKGLFGRK